MPVMSTGQAPMLMLDFANSHMRDRLRETRGLASRSSVRRPRTAKVPAVRTR